MKKYKRLADSELEIMLIIWGKNGSVQTGEIQQIMSEIEPSSHQKIQSTLNRLVAKEFISCEKVGRVNYYTPLVNEEKYRFQETDNFLEKMYNNSPVKLFANLVDNQFLTESEIDELMEILEGKQKE